MKTLLALLAVAAEFLVLVILVALIKESTGRRSAPGLLVFIFICLAGWTWRSITKKGPEDK